MKKHFVTFFSPGTVMAEQTTKPIEKWDTDEAVKMAKKIKERYGARPYGFRFSTRERGPDDLDSKVTLESSMYFLGGTVETVEQIEARANPKEKILLSNMKGNGWKRVVVNDNSWRWTQPLEEADVVLQVKL